MTPNGYRIGVLSDTHGYLPPEVFRVFDGVDLVLHAGDVGREDILTELEALAPVEIVPGNVDGFPLATRPRIRQFETPLGRIILTHGHLDAAPARHPERLLARFRDDGPAVIIYGHTHIASLREVDGIYLFNPGAAGRSQVGGRKPSVGLIARNEADDALHFEHVELQ